MDKINWPHRFAGVTNNPQGETRMQQIKPLATAVALAALVSAGSSAHAAFDAATTITDLQFQVVDLDLADALDPYWQFTAAPKIAARAEAGNYNAREQRFVENFGATFFGDIAATTAVTSAQGSANWIGSSIQARSSFDDSQAWSGGYIRAEASILVAPHARLVLSGNIDSEVTTTAPCVNPVCEQGSGFVYALVDAPTNRQTFWWGATVEAVNHFPNAAFSGPFAITFENVADTPTTFALMFMAGAGGSALVPEPGTAVLGAVGLAWLVARQRRRQS